MMTTDRVADLMRGIESKEFFAQCAHANDKRQLVRIFESLAITDALFRAAVCDDVIIGRINYLLHKPFNKAYANPHDVAIAAYLWVLDQRGKVFIIADTYNLFWARKVAAGVLQ